MSDQQQNDNNDWIHGLAGIKQADKSYKWLQQYSNALAGPDEQGPDSSPAEPPTESEPPAQVGESAMPEPSPYPDGVSSTPAEADFFAGKVNPEAAAAGADAEALESAAGAETNMLGAGMGALGMLGGAVSVNRGIGELEKGTEQGDVDGALDVGSGALGIVGGGLSTAAALGAGGSIAAAAPVVAPIAAAVGLGVAGDHRAESMHLFGKDSEGNYQGAVEAAWNEGQHLGDATDQALGGGTLGEIGGATVAGLSTVGLEAGAAVADVGLGVDALGASSGLFGTAKNADGVGTHNMGAMEAMDHAGQAAGSGVDSLLGLDPNSTAGSVVGDVTEGLVDAAGAPLAVAADLAGGVVGGVEAAGSWVADLF